MAQRTASVKLQAEIDGFKRAMNEAAQSTDKLGAGFDKTGKKIDTVSGRMVRSAELNREGWQQAGQALTVFGTVGVAALGYSVKAAMDWESAWTGVLKTVDGSHDQLAQLEDDLRNMALRLPASATEIAGVAEAAGQLGVKVKDVAAFTEVMINLGETTNLTAEEAATALARIANIMGTTVTDISRMGAAIVDLGNNSATTEREIVDFSTRLAAAAKQAGLSEADMLAFASAMTSVGVEAEAGGTAMSKVFTSIADSVRTGNDDLKTFAQVAGVSTAEFKRAFEEDAATAITMFLEGMGKMSNAGESTTAIFDELELTDQRLMRAVLSLGSAEGLLADQLATSNQAWEDNTALIEEANKRYDTTEAKVSMARNALNDAAITIGEDLLPMLAQLATGVADVASWFADLPDPVRQSLTGLTGVVSITALAAGGFLMLFPRIMDVNRAFGGTGTMSPGVASGLGKVGKAAGVAAVAFVVLGAAATAVDAALTNDDSVAETTKKLLEMSDAANAVDFPWTWDMAKAFKMVEGATYGAAGGVDKFLNGITFGIPGKLEGVTAARTEFDKMGQSLASIYASDPALAAEKFNAIQLETGASTEHLLGLMPAYADSLAEAENQTVLTADATAGMTSATDDYTDALTEQLDLQREASGIALDQWDALTRYAEAVDTATDALYDENGALIAANATLDINTEAGRTNRAELSNLAQSTWDWVKSGQAAGETTGELSTRLAEGREAFINTATQMGLTRDEAEALADEMNLIPTKVYTAFQTPGLATALSQVNALNNAIKRIPGRTRYTVEGSYTGGSTFADGGTIPGSSPHPRADNIPIMATAGEFMQPVAAVNYWGVDTMEAIRRRDSDALWRTVTAKGLADGGPVTGSSGFASSAPALSVTASVGAVTARLAPEDIRSLGDYIINASRNVSNSTLDHATRGAQLAQLAGVGRVAV